MTSMTNQAVDDLQRMTVPRLRERYAEVFGEPTRSGNRQFLVRRIAWRLQAMDEGDLTDRARRRAAELARDADLRVRAPSGPILASPPVAAPTAAFRRTLTVTGRVVQRGDQRLPGPGTVLRREFKGVEHLVTVLADGFEYEGKAYRSLSAVATAISGSHWNGFVFFGLKKEPA